MVDVTQGNIQQSSIDWRSQVIAAKTYTEKKAIVSQAESSGVDRQQLLVLRDIAQRQKIQERVDRQSAARLSREQRQSGSVAVHQQLLAQHHNYIEPATPNSTTTINNLWNPTDASQLGNTGIKVSAGDYVRPSGLGNKIGPRLDNPNVGKNFQSAPIDPTNLAGGQLIRVGNKNLPYLRSGVYTGSKNEMVVVKEGHAAKTAGELLPAIQHGPFEYRFDPSREIPFTLQQRADIRARAEEAQRQAVVKEQESRLPGYLGLINEEAGNGKTGPVFRGIDTPNYALLDINKAYRSFQAKEFLAIKKGEYAKGLGYRLSTLPLGIGYGIVKELSNVKDVATNIGSGFAFGLGEEGIKLAAKEPGFFFAPSRVFARALPVINVGLLGLYAKERYPYAKAAFSTGDSLSFIGETGTQLITFGIGAGVGKGVLPKSIPVSGELVGPVRIESVGGKLEYSGVGQEVNPPINPSLIRQTYYEERPGGLFGKLAKTSLGFGNIKTRVQEFEIPGGGSARTIERVFGPYKFVSLIRPEYGTSEGVPLEKTFVYRKGSFIREYTLKAQDFGSLNVGEKKIIIPTEQKELSLTVSKNVDKELSNDQYRFYQPGKGSQVVFLDQKIPYRIDKLGKNALLPEEVLHYLGREEYKLSPLFTGTQSSTLFQAAGQERLLKVDRSFKNVKVRGIIGVGTSAEVLSGTREGYFEFGTSPGVKPPERGLIVSGKEPVYGGTFPVALEISPIPENAFVSTRSSFYQNEPIQKQIFFPGKSEINFFEIKEESPTVNANVNLVPYRLSNSKGLSIFESRELRPLIKNDLGTLVPELLPGTYQANYAVFQKPLIESFGTQRVQIKGLLELGGAKTKGSKSKGISLPDFSKDVYDIPNLNRVLRPFDIGKNVGEGLVERNGLKDTVDNGLVQEKSVKQKYSQKASVSSLVIPRDVNARFSIPNLEKTELFIGLKSSRSPLFAVPQKNKSLESVRVLPSQVNKFSQANKPVQINRSSQINNIVQINKSSQVNKLSQVSQTSQITNVVSVSVLSPTSPRSSGRSAPFVSQLIIPPVVYPRFGKEERKKKKKYRVSSDRLFSYTPTLFGTEFVGKPLRGSTTTGLSVRPVLPKRGRL